MSSSGGILTAWAYVDKVLERSIDQDDEGMMAAYTEYLRAVDELKQRLAATGQQAIRIEE